MYGISTYIYHKDQPNVGKYTGPKSYGIFNDPSLHTFVFLFAPFLVVPCARNQKWITIIYPKFLDPPGSIMEAFMENLPKFIVTSTW